MANLPNETVAQVQRQVSAAFAAISAKDDDRKDAREVFNTAANDAGAARESALVTLAEAAFTNRWDGEQVEMGVDAAKAARNTQKDTSINTFASEIKRALHPSVRPHVKSFFALAAEAWEAEGKLDKKLAKPLRQAFARRYHMVVGEMFAAAKAGIVCETPQDLVERANAVIRERELDYTAVAKRLKVIRDQLEKFGRDFPLDGITACVEFLDSVEAKDLKACVKPDAVTAPAPSDAPEHDASDTGDDEPAEGASDLLADVLSDMQGMSVAA